MTVTATLTGDKALRRELKRLTKSAPRAVLNATFEEAALIFIESQEQVPVDTGRLRSSGIVAFVPGADSFMVMVGYGTNYAFRIHEDEKLDEGRQHRAELSLSNPGYKPRGSTTGKSKFLSDPYDEALPGLEGRIAARARQLMGRGGLGAGGSLPRPIRGKKKGR